MSNDTSNAMFARIASYPKAFSAVIAWLRQAWSSPNTYPAGMYYMRGPGPKWREKHARAGIAQQPLMLGDKWDQ
jgi:hypothetical protein